VGVKIALWVLGIVALATVVAVAGSNRGDDIASDLPRPSRAFCAAAARYDEAVSSGSLSLARHERLTRAIASKAPRDVRADAEKVADAYAHLRAGDRSVVDDPEVKAALDHVNRRATQDCGWFRRQEGGM
jgi:hypothetical protein